MRPTPQVMGMEWHVGRAWSSPVTPIKHYNVRMNMHKRTLFRNVQYWLYLPPTTPRIMPRRHRRRRRSRTRRNHHGGGGEAIRAPHKSPSAVFSSTHRGTHPHTPRERVWLLVRLQYIPFTTL